MPIVYDTPQPKHQWYNTVGEGGGLAARILLAMLSGGATGLPSLGQKPTTPTPGNPGSIQFPSGATTSTSPLEMALMSQMGGAPTRQGDISPVTYQQPTRFGLAPSMENQARERYIQSMTKAGQQQIGGQAQPSGNAAVSYLSKKALEGDEEAIATLQAMGVI